MAHEYLCFGQRLVSPHVENHPRNRSNERETALNEKQRRHAPLFTRRRRRRCALAEGLSVDAGRTTAADHTFISRRRAFHKFGAEPDFKPARSQLLLPCL